VFAVVGLAGQLQARIVGMSVQSGRRRQERRSSRIDC
jgi:hypothetical protein